MNSVIKYFCDGCSSIVLVTILLLRREDVALNVLSFVSKSSWRSRREIFRPECRDFALDIFRSSRLSVGLIMRVTVRLLIRVRTANETPKNNSWRRVRDEWRTAANGGGTQLRFLLGALPFPWNYQWSTGGYAYATVTNGIAIIQYICWNVSGELRKYNDGCSTF